MARTPTLPEQPVDSSAGKPVCGIIMPISGAGEYTDDHWRRVQRIITKAIVKADMTPRLVWENPEVDVIHSRILQNIYESDVVICDVSGLNANVMLELGLRLSTKRPTIVITDGVIKPPFDLSVYQYHGYQRDLEYNSLDGFITELAEKARHVYSAYGDNKYKSFVENFTFEVVEPSSVTVSAEEALRERIDQFAQQLNRMEGRINAPSRLQVGSSLASFRFSFDTGLGSDEVAAVIDEIKELPGIREASYDGNEYEYTVTVRFVGSHSSSVIARRNVEAIIKKHDLPF